MSATIGTLAALVMAGMAAVDSTSGQETRTMSAPASSSWRTWSMVAAASAVSVLVIDCTLIGASPPTSTEPTRILRDGRRRIARHGRTAVWSWTWSLALIGAENRRSRLRTQAGIRSRRRRARGGRGRGLLGGLVQRHLRGGQHALGLAAHEDLEVARLRDLGGQAGELRRAVGLPGAELAGEVDRPVGPAHDQRDRLQGL